MQTRTILKRATILVSVLFALAFFTYVITFNESHCWPNNDQIHPVNYVMIQNGMSMDEVETVLGKERNYGLCSGWIMPTTWWGSRYIIRIDLDNRGLVKAKTIELHSYLKPTLSDRFYKWIYGL